MERVYLLGADPFRKYCPTVKIITMCAAVRDITTKTDKELRRLVELGVNDIYVGIETGSTA